MPPPEIRRYTTASTICSTNYTVHSKLSAQDLSEEHPVPPTWKEIKAGDIRAGGFSLNGKWVPLYNIHKTYAGLRDAYLYAHSDLARQMLIDLTDWMIDITSGLSDNQMQDMLRSEHGGLK